MATEYVPESKTKEIPKGVGVDGYLSVVREVLQLDRVQRVEITVGQVAWTRFKHAGETESIVGMDLDTLLPYAVIRTREVVELVEWDPRAGAAAVLGEMFWNADRDGLHPVAFVAHPATHLHKWYNETSGGVLPRDNVFGVPLLPDQNLEPETIILCAGYVRGAALVDTVRSYKIAIPWRTT